MSRSTTYDFSNLVQVLKIIECQTNPVSRVSLSAVKQTGKGKSSGDVTSLTHKSCTRIFG